MIQNRERQRKGPETARKEAFPAIRGFATDSLSTAFLSDFAGKGLSRGLSNSATVLSHGLRDAARYLGLKKNQFNELVRPHVTKIWYGPQSLGFDVVDLDRWLTAFKESNERPGHQKGGKRPWDARQFPVSSTGRGRGTSTNGSEEEEFPRVVARATSKKPKPIS